MSSALSFSASSSAAWAALCELSDPSRATRIFLNSCFDAALEGSAIYFTVFVSNLLADTQLWAGRKVFALAVGSRSRVSRVPAVEKKSWNRSVGRGPQSSCPNLAYSRSELVGGVVNVRARSRSGRAFQCGLRGVMHCTVDRRIDSSEKPYTHWTVHLDWYALHRPVRGSPYPQASLQARFPFLPPPIANCAL